MSMSKEQKELIDRDARSFYSPVAIAVYCIVFLPVGMLLQGRNLLNRGARVMAVFYISTALLLATFITIGAALGGRAPSMWLFGAAAAAFVISTESAPFNREIRKGGRRARWWIPLLWVIGWLVFMAVLFALFGDTEAMGYSAQSARTSG